MQGFHLKLERATPPIVCQEFEKRQRIFAARQSHEQPVSGFYQTELAHGFSKTTFDALLCAIGFSEFERLGHFMKTK
jgi:hypothetical protein